jgi:hypothetical protein
VEENRNHWYPTENNVTREIIWEHYMELFYPTETAWRERTVQDFTTAAMGVLNAKLK